MVDKIKRNIVEDSAVTQPKIASGAVDNTVLNKTAITGLTELSEQAASDDVLLIYDASADALKKVTRARTTTLASPVYSSVTPTTTSTTTGTVSFTITGTGFTAGANARLIGNGGQRRNFNTVTRNSATQLTAVFDATLFSASETPYDIQVINGEGLSVIGANQIEFNQVPVFVTGSGSLGSVGNLSRTGVRFVINANDPDSAGNVTYELQSGSLPAGLSLSSEGSEGGIGVISGNATAVGSDTTSNFVIRAVDPASNTTSRSFSITVLAPATTSFTSSGTFAVPTGVTAADVLVVAGGGGGALGATGPGGGGGGGGGGGLIYFPAYPLTAQGTVAVTVGCGGSANNSAGNSAQPAHKGQDSVFGGSPSPGLGQGGVLTAKGGGGGGAYAGAAGGCGGSGGGGGAGSTGLPTTAGPANQATQPGNSGAYGFGNDGAQGNTGGSAGGGAGGGAGGAGVGGGFGGGVGGGGKSYTIADGTTSVEYAGGAGGGQGSPGQQTQGVGQGGGGQGGVVSGDPTPRSSTAGQANRGGGGGGGEADNGQGSAGGKGIVIVRY
tara:strand:- start:33 stop:1694 length:1662 start_codon:yes stop_codon:yes gene_type:complete